MPDYFVSYAREDGGFVDRLRAELTARGHDVWLDRSRQLGGGIEPGEDWRVSTEEGIDRSDAFVFVLSPSSLASGPCHGELARAVASSKRLLPVCLQDPFQDVEIPAAIRDLSWVMMRPADDFDAGVDALIRGHDIDIEVVREHTRLLVRAKAWELAGRRSSPLLRGQELRSAEDWLSRAATAGAPPTEIQRDFIVASRRSATGRQRQALVGALAVATIAIALSVFALIQRSHAVHESNLAFARQLDTDAQAEYSTDPELSVLLAGRSAQIEPGQDPATLQTALADSEIRDRYDLVARNRAGDVIWSPAGTRLLVTSPGTRGHAWARIFRPGSDAKPISMPGPSTRGASGWDASGDRVVIGGERPAVYDADTGRLVARIPGSAEHAALSANGTEVVDTDRDSIGHVYDLATGQMLVSFHPRDHGAVSCFALSPDGRYVAQCDVKANETAESPASLDIWRVRTGKLVRSIPAPTVISSVGFSPTSRRFVFTCSYPPVPNPTASQLEAVAAPGTFVYDTTGNRAPVKTFRGEASDATFGPDPIDQFVTWATTSDSLGHVYQFYDHRQLKLTGATAELGQIAVDSSGAYVLTASDDGDIRIYDSGLGGQPIETLAGDTAPVTAASFGGLGEYVASSSDDGTARVWQGPRPIPIAARPDVPAGDGGVASIGYEVGGRRIVVTGGAFATGTGRIIDAKTLRTVATFHAAPGQLLAGSAISRKGSTLAALTVERTGTRMAVDTFDDRTGAPLATVTPEGGQALVNAAVSPTGSTLALLDASGVVELRAARSGRLLHLLPGDGAAAPTLVFSRDGAQLAVVHDPGSIGGAVTVQIWNIATGRLLRTIGGPEPTSRELGSASRSSGADDPVPMAAAFSPNGRQLALAAATSAVEVYDLTTGRLVHQWSLLDGPGGSFAGSLAFSPDGTMLAAGGTAGTYVWHLPSDNQMVVFPQTGAGASPEGLAPAVRVSFSSDSRYLVTRQGEGEVTSSLDEWKISNGAAVFSESGIADGAATANGSRLVTASLIGINVYTCTLCGDLKQLVALARRRVTGGFTPAERSEYLRR